jgi:hypothetical protein
VSDLKVSKDMIKAIKGNEGQGKPGKPFEAYIAPAGMTKMQFKR